MPEFVRGVARALVADEHAAEDVAQDSLLKAYLHPPRWNTGLRAWLARVVSRGASNLRRSERRRKTRERAVAVAEASSPPAVEAVDRHELLRLVVEVALRLPEPYRSQRSSATNLGWC